MPSKLRRWTTLLQEPDYEALVMIAEELGCTPSEVVRRLIRRSAKRRGIAPKAQPRYEAQREAA